jgi:tetratricopeptide (TPR) repeat protein
VASLRAGIIGAAVVLAGSMACRAREKPRAHAVASEEASAAAPVLRAQDVEFAGCAVVLAGPRCELREARELTFWAPLGLPLEASSDRGVVPLRGLTSVDSGTRCDLRVPEGASYVELRAKGGTGGLRLPVTAAKPVPVLVQAAALRAQGKYAEAHELLRSQANAVPADLRDRADALSARLLLSESDYDGAARGLRASFEAAAAAGRSSDAVYDATALAYVLTANLHDYAAARDVLARADQVAARDPASAALLPHYRGLLALETGDLRAALALFREASRRTERLGLREHEQLARQKEAETLALLGRQDEAIETQRRALEHVPEGNACRQVDAHEQLLWLAILARPEQGSALAALAQRSSAAAERELAACASPWRTRNHAINRGLLALQLGERDAAAAALATIDHLQGGQDAPLSTWALELRGRVALALRRPKDALVAFQHALALSQRAGLWDNEHLAQVGIGRSFEALGRVQPAIDAYSAADTLMGRLLGSIPLGEGQAGFLHEREAGTEQLVALLVQRGKPEQALAVARRARARVMQSVSHAARLERMDAGTRARFEAAIARYRSERARIEHEQAEAWKLPADRLAASQAAFARQHTAALEALDAAHALLQGGLDPSAAPPELGAGKALLAYFPAGSNVIAFVARGDKTTARVLPGVDVQASPAALGAALLAPLAAELEGAPRIRVITHAALARLDVHAFELDGAPAITRYAFAYGLDGAPQSAARTAGGAVVVADPTGDLPASAREGSAVVRALGAAPVKLLMREQATRATVIDALAGASLFHYAGHGQFAGTEGIDSGLRLSDGQLSLGDILSLRAAPGLVVLSACEGARADGPGFAGGLSLAQAFIAAGVPAVIASTRPVADDVARALVEAFYAARARDPKGDAVAALRSAQIALRTLSPSADWASFRALVP